jgi:hypothetical protein
VCFYFLFFIFINSDGSRSNECANRSDFLKYDFYYCYGHANFCLFSVPISIWEFFALCFAIQVGLQFGTLCPNMSTNINVNFHTPGDCLISYNSIVNQIFISWTGRKKTSLLFSNVMISQMMKSEKLKF